MSGCCASSTPVITFSFDAWIALFPEFIATVSSAQATAYSMVAAGLIDITGQSPLACNLTQMALVWNFVTAHVAQLMVGTTANPASSLVGRISNASEGSVSVAVSLPETTSQLGGWLQQTKYGETAWAMLGPTRMGFYVPGVRVIPLSPWGGYPIGVLQLPFLRQ